MVDEQGRLVPLNAEELEFVAVNRHNVNIPNRIHRITPLTDAASRTLRVVRTTPRPVPNIDAQAGGLRLKSQRGRVSSALERQIRQLQSRPSLVGGGAGQQRGNRRTQQARERERERDGMQDMTIDMII